MSSIANTTEAADNRRRVLIVDDNELDRRLLSARLQSSDIEVVEAIDGPSALGAGIELRPDLILLDLGLPGWDGFETLKHLKYDHRTRNIPVIFISAETQIQAKAHGLDLGAVDFVTKPFESIELNARVQAALRTKFMQDLLEQQANLDGLTGLGNRRALDQRLASEWLTCQKRCWPLSVLIVDLDHFKRDVNDAHGHAAGDEVLRGAARTLRTSVRGGDFVGRYGGEEFVVLAPDCDLRGALIMAERFRQGLASTGMNFQRITLEITASIGVATVDTPWDVGPGQLCDQADSALYRAKAAGRNAVWAWSSLLGNPVPAKEAPLPPLTQEEGEATEEEGKARGPTKPAITEGGASTAATSNAQPHRDPAQPTTPDTPPILVDSLVTPVVPGYPRTISEQPHSILIIDDNELDRRVLISRLQTESLDFLEASDSATGISLARESLPDLILLDLYLPSLDGFEVLRILKEDPRTQSIPVVFLSASTSTTDKARGLDLGAIDFVTKPFDPVELRARVRSVLRTKFLRDLLEQMAHLDGLTGLGNRQALDGSLMSEWTDCVHRDRSIALLMIDLDHFRAVNNTYGHTIGDEVLRRVASLLKATARAGDTVGRFGGEEFLIVAPDCDRTGVLTLAERIRVGISTVSVSTKQGRVRVTASIGVACELQPEPGQATRLREQSDQALYVAKNSGRDQVRYWDDEAGEAVAASSLLRTPRRRPHRMFRNPRPPEGKGQERRGSRRRETSETTRFITPAGTGLHTPTDVPLPIDSVTGIGTRQAFDSLLVTHWQDCRQRGRPLSLIFLDLTRGEEILAHFDDPTTLLVQLTEILSAATRVNDYLARNRNAEFLIIAPDCTIEGILTIAERFAAGVRGCSALRNLEEGLNWNVSVGATNFAHEAINDPHDLVQQASTALDFARSCGTDEVWVWDHRHNRPAPAHRLSLFRQNGE